MRNNVPQTFVQVKYRNFCLWAKYILQAKHTGTSEIMYPSYKLIYRHNTLLLAQYTCVGEIMTIFYNLFYSRNTIWRRNIFLQAKYIVGGAIMYPLQTFFQVKCMLQAKHVLQSK